MLTKREAELILTTLRLPIRIDDDGIAAELTFNLGFTLGKDFLKNLVDLANPGLLIDNKNGGV